MILTHGTKYVEQHPNQAYRRQYAERVDHFPVGLLLLEIFFAAWQGPGADPGDAAPHVAEVCTAWRKYWTSAHEFFQQFHRKGHKSIRERFARSDDLARHVESLRVLITTLRAACKRLMKNPIASVFQIAADLLSAC